MFEQFENRFVTDPISGTAGASIADGIDHSGLQEFFLRYVGKSFNNELYRILNSLIKDLSQELVTEDFPDFCGRATGFSYDWLGAYLL
jgi:hypothetical protein